MIEKHVKETYPGLEVVGNTGTGKISYFEAYLVNTQSQKANNMIYSSNQGEKIMRKKHLPKFIERLQKALAADN